MAYKQVIIVRQDLKMPKGKLASQVSHASLESALKTNKKILSEWRNAGGKKVVLKIKDENELLRYKKIADNFGLKTALIIDAGHTVLKPGTITCLGIGPDEEGKIDKITGKLKIL